MSLQGFYSDHIYNAPLTSDSWGGNSASGFDVDETITGFLQFKSGSENTEYSSSNEKVDAVLYTGVTTIVKYGGKINNKYKVISGDQDNGISGVGHHKEILLSGKV